MCRQFRFIYLCNVMSCHVLSCDGLHCTALCCTVLYCTVLFVCMYLCVYVPLCLEHVVIHLMYRSFMNYIYRSMGTIFDTVDTLTSTCSPEPNCEVPPSQSAQEAEDEAWLTGRCITKSLRGSCAISFAGKNKQFRFEVRIMQYLL